MKCLSNLKVELMIFLFPNNDNAYDNAIKTVNLLLSVLFTGLKVRKLVALSHMHIAVQVIPCMTPYGTFLSSNLLQ